MNHVVMFSGGLGSWAAAKRVAAKYGTDDLTLLFTDTKMEDEDLYRFLHEAAANVGGKLVILSEGRDPWQVFHDERFLGNSRADPCSKILKRQIADRYLASNFTPETCIRYVGIDWTEEHRFTRLVERLAPWKVEAPMCEPPYMSKKQVIAWCESEGIQIPRLYKMGFGHNNCGGFCVKAGQAHFRLLLERLPERYAYHEQKEQEIRAVLGDVSILSDRSGDNIKKPLTLRDFRERLQNGGGQCDMFDWGGCGCFVDEEPALALAEAP